MFTQDDLEQLNREIGAIAAQIARHRELIEEMRGAGKDTAAAESALDALVLLYKQRLEMRQARLAGSPDEAQERQSTTP